MTTIGRAPAEPGPTTWSIDLAGIARAFESNRLTWMAIAVPLAVLLMLIPIAPHDWGDDFSMYIMQAATYAGDSSYSGLYIHIPDTPMYGPSAYPPGFPLMLAPVFAITGINLEAMQYYMCLILALTGVAALVYSRATHLSFMLSLLAAGIVCFHPFSLELRQHILSDIPFAGLVLLFFYFHRTRKRWYIVALAALAAVLTRSAGLALVGAWLGDILFILMFERSSKEALIRNLKGFTALLTGVLPALPLISGYSSRNDGSVFDTVRENYVVYEALVGDYFRSLYTGDERVLTYVTWIFLFLCLTGVYAFLRKGERIPVFFIGLYALLILRHPYTLGGYRMIFPMIPMMWIFIFYGIQHLYRHTTAATPQWHRPVVATLTVGMGILLILQAVNFAHITFSHGNHVETSESRELFAAVKERVPSNEILLSPKPRALALFTKHPGIYIGRDPVRPDTIRRFVAKHNVTHVVTMKNKPHRNIDLLAADVTSVELLWRNKTYALYRVRG